MKKAKSHSDKKKKTIFLVAGGSGGHILPALQLGKQWKDKNPNGSIVFIGQKGLLDQKIIGKKEFLDHTILLRMGKFSLRTFWKFPILAIQLLMALIKGYRLCKTYNPEKIISTGGLIAMPICFAGHLKKKKIELYELNVIPGKAVKFLAPIADNIALVFNKTTQYIKASQKYSLQNYPVRFTKKQTAIHKTNLLTYINQLITKKLKFNHTRKTLFILGGSQGSLMLNNLIKKFIEGHHYQEGQLQVIHQTGTHGTTNWEEFYAMHKIPAFTFSFYKEIEHCYLLADLVLCRAGAGTMFELLFFEKKSIVVPLVAQTTDHQVANAREMERKNPDLFTIFEQKTIKEKPELLFDTIAEQLWRQTDKTLIQKTS